MTFFVIGLKVAIAFPLSLSISLPTQPQHINSVRFIKCLLRTDSTRKKQPPANFIYMAGSIS